MKGVHKQMANKINYDKVQYINGQILKAENINRIEAYIEMICDILNTDIPETRQGFWEQF